MDEAVLRRQVGGASVMEKQLRHLVRLSEISHVTIRVLPFSAGAHAGLDGAFYLLEFPDQEDPDVVYLEQATSGLVPEAPEEVRRYTLMFGTVLAKALSPAESTALLASMAE
ncbi:hypothetical protein HNR25_002394 [Streptomonospora salina]|uniref:DUF5753 domain-containing protein n=1 Tax=Streptomonospora salina TaxID=104205 RepID=A0A841EC56_9ACTN|nr:hypothetical protein [Streptomonospora salina]